MNIKKSKWLLVFNLLVVYIFFQFIWWSILIANQLKQIHGKTELYHKKLWMIFGEGFVFLIILATGVYFVRRSFKKEMEINNNQKNFLLAVTHELKTPIAVSKLSLETIANRKLDEEKRNKIIEKAILETDRLNSLVENILLSVKIDEKNLELRMRKTNIGELVSKQVEMLYQTIGQNHQLSLNIQNDCFANVDAIYFASIVSNLFENAIKYTQQNTTIGVDVYRKNTKTELCIWDNGTGINAIDREQIFNRFYRGGSEETRTTKGTGLGLFITKQLVSMHNGTITCENNLPSGVRFTVTLESAS